MSACPICQRKPGFYRKFLTGLTILSISLAGNAYAATVEILLGAKTYRVELATTVEERRRGLMHRPRLEHDEGLMLVYAGPGNHRIWMKNMLIPLRVYWIDADFTVIEVQRVEPCTGDPCPIYSAGRDSQCILELGDYEHPLAPGDRLSGFSID